MRVERHDDGGGAVLAGASADTLENLAMAAMDAIEVAERQHRLHPARRARVVREMNDVHQSNKARQREITACPLAVHRTPASSVLPCPPWFPVVYLLRQTPGHHRPAA